MFPTFHPGHKWKYFSVSLMPIKNIKKVDNLSAHHFGYVMDGFTQTCVDAIVDAFDLSQHKVAIDIGG